MKEKNEYLNQKLKKLKLSISSIIQHTVYKGGDERDD